MNKYHRLKSIYYQAKNNPALDYQEVVEARRNNEVAIHTGLIMSPFQREFKTSDHDEIFFLPIPQMLNLNEQIYNQSRSIERKMNHLNKTARDQIFYNNLIEELQSTNEIEGVKSTREEISEILDKVKRNEEGAHRFKGLVRLYGNFQKERYSFISGIEDFRIIWNELVGLEIAEKDQPDGKFFRKSAVNILAGDKVVHRGDTNETEIISDLEKLIAEMNNKEIPSLPKCFLAHYYFEYIHPFYDGNGRVGRFVACSYLARKLDRMSAIKFSTAIVKQRESYYKAFNEMADPYNKGEGTYFIIAMMKLLSAGQVDLIDRIDRGISSMEQSRKVIKNLNLTENAKKILLVLTQKEIFGYELSPIKDVDLGEMLHCSRYLIKKAIDELENLDFVEIKSMNPKSHGLSGKAINKIIDQ